MPRSISRVHAQRSVIFLPGLANAETSRRQQALVPYHCDRGEKLTFFATRGNMPVHRTHEL